MGLRTFISLGLAPGLVVDGVSILSLYCFGDTTAARNPLGCSLDALYPTDPFSINTHHFGMMFDRVRSIFENVSASFQVLSDLHLELNQ